MSDPLYLYEFLYRGRAPGSSEPPAYHVILAQEVRDGFGVSRIATGPAMTPDQAEAAGFPLSAIAAGIDAAALARADRESAAAATAEAARVETQARLDAALAEVAHLRERLASTGSGTAA